MVSRYFSAKKYNDLKKTVHTAVAIGLVGGVLLTVIGYFLAPYFLGWMNTPVDIHDQALGYVRVYFFSLTAIAGYNIFSGVLRASTIRGAGKSLPPMVIILTSMCVFRPALLKVMMHYFNNALCIAVIYPVTWFIAALLLGVYYYSSKMLETKR
ncbi:MAG: MATE family efflux transporter [Lachnospiraceae bacterium]